MKYCLWAVAVAAALTSCTSLTTSLENVFGIYHQQATQAPYWRYMADLTMNLGKDSNGHDQVFTGSGVVDLTMTQRIVVTSPVAIDRVEVEMCDREDICQWGQTCASAFNIHGWLHPNGEMRYWYVPTDYEKSHDCNLLQFRIFNKQALLSWGFLVGHEPNDTLPATTTCNGSVIPASANGTSSCNPRAGKINTITFATAITDFDADATCHVKKTDPEHFEFAPEMGLCTALFTDGKRFHELTAIGYDEALVR